MPTTSYAMDSSTVDTFSSTRSRSKGPDGTREASVGSARFGYVVCVPVMACVSGSPSANPGDGRIAFAPGISRAGNPFREIARTGKRAPALPAEACRVLAGSLASRGVTVPDASGRNRARDDPFGLELNHTASMTDLAGKHGLIVGVANKRSISWAIAQAAAAAGARLALTYPSERLEENVRELAATLDNPLIAAVRRRERSADRASSAATIDREFGGLDFLVHGAAFAPRRRSAQPVRRDVARGFRIALDVSAYSLIASDPRGGAADGEARRRQHPDADLSRQPARVHQLQRDGRREGGARIVGALSGGRSRPEEHPRQRDLGGADQDAGGGGHLRLLEHPAGLPRSRAAPAQRRVSAKSPTPPLFLLELRRRARSPARS